MMLNKKVILSIRSLRIALSKPATSIQLCLVGLAAGLVAAVVVIIFRLSFEFIQIKLLGSVGDYSALPNWQLLLLPIIAILIVIFIAKLTGFKHYRLGIPFVIHRFKLHYGHIPLATSINQFFGGILALASGFVVGKEGPTVHLAAAASHYVGRWCKLPFNSLRILAGCGIAAGIAAAFNTPFAAVIFVMEVVIRDYKVHIFIPIMLAAACGSVLTRLVFGDITELSFLTFHDMQYWQLPFLIILGVGLGLLGSLFNQQLMLVMRVCRPLSMITRLLLAAVITGSVGYFMPNALGAEFVNIQVFIEGSPAVQSILLLFAAKFALAIVAIALGVPGGIIGAVMVIGMLAGVIFLQPLQLLFVQIIDAQMLSTPEQLTTNYALLGLAGMLTAVLHAPLAALSAVMELSSTQQVVLPALITIVSAYVTSKQLCNNQSIFIQQLEYQDLPYTTTLIRDQLQNTGVMAIMRTDVKAFDNGSDAQLYGYLQETPEALVVNYKAAVSDDEPANWELVSLDVSLQVNAYPIAQHTLTAISDQNSLAEVYELLYKKRQGGVAILASQEIKIASELSAPTATQSGSLEKVELTEADNLKAPSNRVKAPELCGLITWNMLNNYLLRQQH